MTLTPAPFHALVIDPDRPAGELLRHHLEALGAAVTSASEWEDAWPGMGGTAPHLLIATVPANPAELAAACRRMRDLAGGAQTVVLAKHPRNRRLDRHALLAGGVDDFLAYPIEPDDLVLRLDVARARCLERRDALGRAAEAPPGDPLAHSDDASVTFTLENGSARITSVNAAFERLTAYRAAEVVGRSHRVLVEGRGSEAVLRALRTAAQEGRPQRVRTGGLRPDGRAFAADWSITPLGGQTVLSVLRPAEGDTAGRAAEEKFRALAEVSLQGVLVHQAGVLRFVNRTLALLLGYPGAEAVLARGRLEALVAPEDQARLAGLTGGAAESAPHELTLVRRDGERVLLEGVAGPITWEGEPAHVAAYVDIGERKRVQQQLQESQALLRAVFDAIPYNLYVKGSDRRFLLVNRAMTETWRRPQEAIVGRLFAAGEEPPPGERAAIESSDNVALQEGLRSEAMISRPIPGRGRRRFRLIKVPLRDAAGRITGLVGITEDVTERLEAEEGLRESQALLAAVFNTIPHGLFLKDRDGRLQLVNQPLSSRFGLNPDQMAGTDAAGLSLTPEEQRAMAESDRQVLSTGNAVDYVVPRTFTDGSRHSIRYIKSPLRGPDGTVTGIVGLAEDITERLRSEEALRESRTLFQTTFDSIPVAVFVKNQAGRIVLANRALSVWWDLPQQAFIGQVAAPYPGRDPAEIELATGMDRQVLETGRPVDQVRLVSMPAGRRRLRTVKTPLRNHDGAVVGLVGIAEDITDKEQAKEAQVKSQALLQTVFDAIPHELFIKDRAGRYVAVNRAFVQAWGGTAEGYVGRPPAAWPGAPEEETARVVATDRAVLERGESVEERFSRTKPEGQRHYRVIKVPVRGSGGAIEGLVGIAEDISDRRRAEEALRQSEDRFRRLIEESPYGILIHRNRAALYVNPAFARLFGYGSPAEVLALDSIDYWVADEERARVRGYADSRLRQDGSPPERYEFRGKQKDGTLIWVQNSVRPIEWEGQLAIQATMRDVTERRQAEADLAAGQRLLRTLIDSLPQSIHVKDTEGRYQLVNAAMARQHALPVEALIGRSVDDLPLRNPSQAREIALADRRVVEEDHQVEMQEMSVRRPDDSLAWERMIKAPLHDEAGRVIAVMGIAEDITRFKTIEHELRESQRLLQTVFNTLPQSLSLKDTSGRYLLVNQAFLRRNRVSDEALRLNTSAVLPVLSEDQVERIREADAAVVRAGELVEIPELEIAYPGAETIWVRLIKAPFKDELGRVTGIVSIAEDLTSRKQAEDEVRASQRLLQTVINALPQSLYVKDLKGAYRLVNDGALKRQGLAAPEVLDHHIEQMPLSNATLIEEILRADREVLQRGGLVEIPEVLVAPPGREPSWARVLKTPLLDDKGSIVGIITLVDDITRRKQAEADRLELERQVLHAQKLESLGVLAGGIAHDFNNLLTGILGNVELAAMDLPAGHPAGPTLQHIKQASLRAAGLTQQMLAYSGRGRLQVRAVDLSALVEEMVQLLQVSISKKIAIQFSLRPGLAAVQGDPTQLQQVVMNLITNASEAIGDAPGSILLTTGEMTADRAYLADSYLADQLPEGPYVFLEVTDSGVGMTEEVLARIFDPFFTTKFTGRGLGLAAVLGIVRSHHGTIRIASTPGRGSTFRVLFPASGKVPEAPRRIASGPAPGWRGHGTVLVVDDEDIVRSVMTRQLEALGFSVLTAPDGKEALERFRRDPAGFRAVLLDLTMPGMGGVETLRELRAVNPAVRVIVCSGYSEQDAARQFGGAEPSGFLQKPTQLQDLTDKLKDVLDAD